jgi:hypothetical protein
MVLRGLLLFVVIVSAATTRGGSRPPSSPLACLAKSRHGFVQLEFGENGCFGDSPRHWLRIDWRNRSARLSGAAASNVDAPIPLSEARHLLDGIRAAAERAEVSSTCHYVDGARTWARLLWSCGDDRAEQVDFSSSMCTPDPSRASSASSGAPAKDVYARAIGLADFARDALAARISHLFGIEDERFPY